MEQDISDYIVAEYSPTAKCIHVETVKEMLLDGLMMMRGKGFTDFYPIGIFRTDDECRKFLDKIYKSIKTQGLIL